jgi:hypothetical protein
VVLVDDPQRMKAHPCGIVILIERESVAGVEPAVVSATALVTASQVDHRILLVITTNIAGS